MKWITTFIGSITFKYFHVSIFKINAECLLQFTSVALKGGLPHHVLLAGLYASARVKRTCTRIYFGVFKILQAWWFKMEIHPQMTINILHITMIVGKLFTTAMCAHNFWLSSVGVLWCWWSWIANYKDCNENRFLTRNLWWEWFCLNAWVDSYKYLYMG